MIKKKEQILNKNLFLIITSLLVSFLLIGIYLLVIRNNEIENKNNSVEETYEPSTKETIYGRLEREYLVTEEFPKDIPLCGGMVTSSFLDESGYFIETVIDTASSVEETYYWYMYQLKENGWEITYDDMFTYDDGTQAAVIEIELKGSSRKGYVKIERLPSFEVSMVYLREMLKED